MSDLDFSKIGARIKAARLSKKMSQADLAAKANLALPTISDIERGKNNMGLDTFARIIEALQVSSDSILRADVPEVNILYQNEIGDLLKDCDPDEISAIRDIVKQLKQTMRIKHEDKF